MRHAVAAVTELALALAFGDKAAMSYPYPFRPLPSQGPLMPVRIKKLIGTVIIVALVVLYALVATTVATYRLAESAWYVHLLYFLFTGVLWVVPAMFVIRWMEGPRKDKQVS